RGHGAESQSRPRADRDRRRAVGQRQSARLAAQHGDCQRRRRSVQNRFTRPVLGSCERLVHKLDTFTDENRAAQATVPGLIWEFYADLKAYRCAPTKQRKAALRARFDRIFTRKTGFVTLDRLLARLNANKSELLMVLDRPEIPLHTNGSENDIRGHVTRRKLSGGTRSDLGRDCRDAFLGLAKTCAKLKIAFWDYLGDRLAVPGAHAIPQLPKIILARAQSP